MVANELDTLWDGWMKELSDSYTTTLSLLERNKIDDASEEFQDNFVKTVKNPYSEAATTYPERYDKVAATSAIYGFTLPPVRHTVRLASRLFG